MFLIGKLAFKVFTTIFHNPSTANQPSEIPWTNFLHAMQATGFAPEKLCGSVWQFTPTTLDMERSIQFYDPHPMKKMPDRMVRSFCRRLDRAYGWTGEMLVLKA
jgi:hypothetical protein